MTDHKRLPEPGDQVVLTGHVTQVYPDGGVVEICLGKPAVPSTVLVPLEAFAPVDEARRG